MKKTSYLAIACVILLVAGGIYYFVKEEPIADPSVTAQETSNDSSTPVLMGNTIVEQQNGKKLWELTAEKIELDPNTKLVKLFQLKGVFYKDDGGKIDVTALEATMDTKTKDIVMSGDMKAISSDGAVFTAPLTRWMGQNRKFFGSGGVTLTREDTVITGDQIESDANMEKVRVQGNAHVVKGGASQ